jgi:hypothetical protein
MITTGSNSSDGTPSSGKGRKPSPGDFMFGTTLGEGAYARVSNLRSY